MRGDPPGSGVRHCSRLTKDDPAARVRTPGRRNNPRGRHRRAWRTPSQCARSPRQPGPWRRCRTRAAAPTAAAAPVPGSTRRISARCGRDSRKMPAPRLLQPTLPCPRRSAARGGDGRRCRAPPRWQRTVRWLRPRNLGTRPLAPPRSGPPACCPPPPGIGAHRSRPKQGWRTACPAPAPGREAGTRRRWWATRSRTAGARSQWWPTRAAPAARHRSRNRWRRPARPPAPTCPSPAASGTRRRTHPVPWRPVARCRARGPGLDPRRPPAWPQPATHPGRRWRAASRCVRRAPIWTSRRRDRSGAAPPPATRTRPRRRRRTRCRRAPAPPSPRRCRASAWWTPRRRCRRSRVGW